MTPLGSIIGAGLAAALAVTGATHTADLIDTVRGQSEAAIMATELGYIGAALVAEPVVPESLTCVPDVADPAGLPCVSFSDWDWVVSGPFAYTLTRTTGADFVLTATTADGSQSLSFDSARGGIVSLDGSDLADADALLADRVTP